MPFPFQNCLLELMFMYIQHKIYERRERWTQNERQGRRFMSAENREQYLARRHAGYLAHIQQDEIGSSHLESRIRLTTVRQLAHSSSNQQFSSSVQDFLTYSEF